MFTGMNGLKKMIKKQGPLMSKRFSGVASVEIRMTVDGKPCTYSVIVDMDMANLTSDPLNYMVHEVKDFIQLHLPVRCAPTTRRPHV